MTNNPQYEKLKAQPCECVLCHGCSGEGRIWIGPMDTEICEECDGDQVISPCDRCREMEEIDHDNE